MIADEIKDVQVTVLDEHQTCLAEMWDENGKQYRKDKILLSPIENLRE